MKAVTSSHAARGRWLGLAFLLWAIDQAIKFGVAQTMHLHDSVPVIPGFNWVYVLNPGAAFSFWLMPAAGNATFLRPSPWS